MSEPARKSFDPYSMMDELDRQRVNYIIIGALARVIQESDELTRGFDITPSARPENLERLELALENLNATRPDSKPLALTQLDLAEEPVIKLESRAGEIKLVFEPVGTRGYDDLRRRANREPLGQGLRPSVAASADLVRMLEAQGRDEDRLRIRMMRRVVELERARGLSIER